MKSKKALILWLCAYGVELVGALLLIFLRRAHWSFNAWSAFPLCYMIVCAFLVWYLPSIWNYRREEDARISDHLWNRKNFDERQARWDGIARERDGTWQDPMWTFMSRVCGAMIPMLLPFLFFGSFEIKIASFAFGMIFYVLMMLVWFFFLSGDLKEDKKHQEKVKKELAEQRKREELGKWK